ncbi:uncharacterized protein G2W53_037314 [Senna tora]|uniref:Uncharacterized protein n=1 Tax=Senna tora TaxID=362788 RepID=A0A834SX39_9FABA|nr:uncharacterized protein G2W53_037314 [Senna tora]
MAVAEHYEASTARRPSRLIASWVHINLREEQNQPIGNIELVLVTQIVFNIHEVLPLRLRLLPHKLVLSEFLVRMLKVLLFPLPLFTVAFDLNNERVKSHRFVVVGGMMRCGQSEVGTKLEAVAAMARVSLWGVREKP